MCAAYTINTHNSHLHPHTHVHAHTYTYTHTAIIDELLKHGAHVKEKNRLGWTSLDEAISYGNKSTSKHPTSTTIVKTLHLTEVGDIN